MIKALAIGLVLLAGAGCVLYIRLLLVTPCLRWLSSSARVVFSV